MHKIALALAVGTTIALTACGAPASTTVTPAVTVTAAPAPAVTVTAEPAPAVTVTETPEPIVTEDTTEIIAEAAVRSVWDNMSESDQSGICILYTLAPKGAKKSFLGGFDDKAQGEAAWPYLVSILKTEC